MPLDAFGLPMSAAGAAAVGAYDELVAAYLGFRRDAGDRLKEALAADDKMVMAHVLKGYFYLLFCDPRLDERVAGAVAAARAAAAAVAAEERERRHIAALEAWAAGDLAAATSLWEEILLVWPRDIVALRLAHFTNFYSGDAHRLRDSIARVLPLWEAAEPAYPHVLAMWAFGLEESGDYARAEEAGRRAVELDPANIWAVHAVAHVMEMQGRAAEGLAWIDDTEPAWAGCNNFAYHVWWHRALFHFERGEHDAVLDGYDRQFRADAESEDYLDMSNAIAMLWRLELEGVDVGARWRELADKSERRVRDHVLVFIDAHWAMALAADGRRAALDSMLATMAAAAGADTSQAAIYRRVGSALCEGLIAWRAGDPETAVERLLPIRYDVATIGGSHAQRDVVHQTLIAAALAAGRDRLARALLAERVSARPNSLPTWLRYAACLDRLGDGAAPAAAARARAAELRPG